MSVQCLEKGKIKEILVATMRNQSWTQTLHSSPVEAAGPLTHGSRVRILSSFSSLAPGPSGHMVGMGFCPAGVPRGRTLHRGPNSVVLKLGHAFEACGGLAETHMSGPHPQHLTQWVWGGAISFLLAQGWHFESPARGTPGPLAVVTLLHWPG